jgi:hypothetical protein
MTRPLNAGAKARPPRKDQPAPDIFERLQNRKIEYAQIKRIVQFDRPHDTLLFAQWFKGRTISHVFKQIEEWKALLKKDFILSRSKDLKSQVEQYILRTELFVWGALFEANLQVGPWDLHIELLATGRDEGGQPVWFDPARQIVAVHRETKKKRRVRLPRGLSRPLALQAEDNRRAFEKLGLWDILWKGDVSRRLISKRAPQGWQVFTRFIIPRLYEFLAPYYRVPGHYSEKTDADTPFLKRPARFSGELFEDLLEILRLEYPSYFEKTRPPPLKALIQRHLSRKDIGTKPGQIPASTISPK